MAGRRFLLAVILGAGVLHGISIARSLLPAQDGLKFIHIARQFQQDSWPSVVRETDQHPLYPALIVVVEPAVRLLIGPGPDTWRMAAQIVAAVASLALLLPLYGITRALFDDRIACIAVAIAALLPVPAEVGHDTLSDSLGLLLLLVSLRYGAVALRRGQWRPALLAGLAGGVGYLARPEVVLAPLALCLAWVIVQMRRGKPRLAVASPVVAAMSLSALVLVGSYALVKGHVSEKLALRHGTGMTTRQTMLRAVPQPLPRGLDDPRWDFSPKEESEHIPIRDPLKALRWIACQWWDELCWGFAIMAIWGLVRHRFILTLCRDREPEDRGWAEQIVLATFAGVFLIMLLRHVAALGYLSSRHTLPLVMISVPWAAAGTFVCLWGLAVKLPWSPRAAWVTCTVGMGLVVVTLVVYQLRPGHPSRFGHWAAGCWLAEHATAEDVVLDTRGWARFISQKPGYDYWHVRQALTDSRLSYVVVGHDELAALSPRARTLNALLAYAATPVLDLPVLAGSKSVGVRIYHFHQPSSWEGLVR
jgi:4-amino-4-deoxy-L-arabinose transferase-like glycosyltransferase